MSAPSDAILKRNGWCVRKKRQFLSLHLYRRVYLAIWRRRAVSASSPGTIGKSGGRDQPAAPNTSPTCRLSASFLQGIPEELQNALVNVGSGSVSRKTVLLSGLDMQFIGLAGIDQGIQKIEGVLHVHV